jgi:hypothetical protein
VSDDTDRRSAFEAALGYEYFGLQGLRSASIAEAGTRAGLYFTTLTGTVLALGFLAGNTDAVRWIAYASLPIVVVLGLLSFLRLVEVSIEDVRALQAINKIRAYYGGLVPEAAEYFPAPGRTQAVNTMVDTGAHRGRGRASLTIASSVGVVNTLVCGASVAFAAGDWGLPPPAAAAVGGAVAVVVGWLIFRYQHDRFVAAVGEDDLTDRQSIGHRSAVAHWRPATPSSGQPPG